MVQVPLVTKVNAPPVVTVQTPCVVELKVGDRPDGDAEADSVGLVPKVWAPGLVKVIL